MPVYWISYIKKIQAITSMQSPSQNVSLYQKKIADEKKLPKFKNHASRLFRNIEVRYFEKLAEGTQTPADRNDLKTKYYFINKEIDT